MNVSATDGGNDGNPANARPGVQSLTTYVDGIQTTGQMTYGGSVSGANTQTCPQDNCSMRETMQFVSTAYTPGPHTIEIDATDQLGHTTKTTFAVTTSDAPSVPVIWAPQISD